MLGQGIVCVCVFVCVCVCVCVCVVCVCVCVSAIHGKFSLLGGTISYSVTRSGGVDYIREDTSLTLTV